MLTSDAGCGCESHGTVLGAQKRGAIRYSPSFRFDLGLTGSMLWPVHALMFRFREQLRSGELDKLDDTWLELVESGVTTAELVRLADEVARHGAGPRAAVLLWVLAESLAEGNRHEERLAVLRRLTELTPGDRRLARELADALRRVYGPVVELEQALIRSGLVSGAELSEALPRLDRYLAFLPGVRVYEAERGAGRVKKLDLLLDKVTVDFDRGAELTWDIAVAARQVRPSAPDGFFVRLARDPESLSRLAREHAGALVAMYLRDVGEPVSVRQLQEGLGSVIPAGEWEGFWSRARSELGKNRHVVVKAGTVRLYQWVDEPPEDTRLTKKVRRVRYEVNEAEIAAMPESEVEELYARLNSSAERRKLLEVVRAARPSDWDRLYVRLFNIGDDSRARLSIERALREDRPGLWDALLDDIVTGYRRNPEPFVWFAEQAERLGRKIPKAVLARVVDLLDSSEYRLLWNRLQKLVAADDYRLVRGAVAVMDRAEAERLLARIPRLRPLEGYRADEIVQLIVGRFPELDETVVENVIYTTREGLEKARAELRRLTSEEIPKAAEEIARARAHGDLSENYEYKAAKEKQARLMQRANRLRDEVARARVIVGADVDVSEVSVGCRVTLSDESGGRHVYVLLGPWDTNTDQGIISYQSPFAGMLMGKKVGELVEVEGRPHTIVAIESAVA